MSAHQLTIEAAPRTYDRGPAPQAKLTLKEAYYIRTAPEPIKQLARDHGVCPKTVRQIRNGEIWRWL